MSVDEKTGYLNTAFEGENGNTLKNNGVSHSHFTVTDIEADGKVREADDDDDDGEKLDDDPWTVATIEVEETPWSDLSAVGFISRFLKYLFGIVLILGFLYLFICSLDFLSSAFKLLGGKAAGQVFQNNEILSNPVAGLMIGVLVTVLVQSSSTSTSIVISMVGADILTISIAIPIIMGANIGTSVTNTIVAMGQITNKNDFRRAFAGATVHDMFNWLTVIVLLPIEVITGYLNYLSGAIVDAFPSLEPSKSAKRDLLKVITTPFTKMIIEVDKAGITKIAKSESHGSLMKTCSDKVTPSSCCGSTLKEYGVFNNQTYEMTTRVDVCDTLNHCVEKTSCVDLFHGGVFKCKEFALDTECCDEFVSNFNSTGITGDLNSTFCRDLIGQCKNNWMVSEPCIRSAWTNESFFSCDQWTAAETDCLQPKTYLFMGLVGNLGDAQIGAILLVISLAILCICLVCIVKLLNALLKGQIAVIIKKFINANFPGKVCGYFTGYLAILLGAGLTILVQSSSIFTSTLTPLVGIGVIELDRMYPLTLGANIGTTTTGILSALAQDGSKIKDSLQVALCHLFFNISGILIFYPLPFFRPAIPLAKFLGNTTAKYRWFALVYLFLMFFLLPAAVFGLSIPGWYVLAAVLIPIAVIVIIIAIIKVLQNKRPTVLPVKLRNWKWLPEPMRSLRPYDYVMQRICCIGMNKKDDKPSKVVLSKPNENGKVGNNTSVSNDVDTRL